MNVQQNNKIDSRFQIQINSDSIIFEEKSDGSVFYVESPNLTDEKIKVICQAAHAALSTHLKAAVIGQRVYGRDNMVKVYAAMKVIKSGILDAKDFQNERLGWYNLFRKAHFDIGQCFVIMQGIHKQYLDIDRVNRQSDGQRLPQVDQQPYHHLAINQPPINYDHHNNNNNANVDNVKEPPRKKKKAEPTGVPLTQENAVNQLIVLKNGVKGYISSVDKSAHSNLSWITIEWADGHSQKFLSTSFDLRNIYIVP